MIDVGLLLFYGYEMFSHGLDLLKHSNRLILFQSNEISSNNKIHRRLYQFSANKNQVPIYSLSTSQFCSCTFYREHVLEKNDYFACPHNIAIKLHQRIFSDIEIETFEVPDDYIIQKIFRLLDLSCDSN